MILSGLKWSEDLGDSQVAGVSLTASECKPVVENDKSQTVKKVGMFYTL